MQQQAAIGVRIRAHAPFTVRRKFGQFRPELPLVIEELVRPVAPQPIFQQLEMTGVGGGIGERHLVRTEGPST